jgi:hypothetical protein
MAIGGWVGTASGNRQREATFHPEAASFRIETDALDPGRNLQGSVGWHAI